MADPNSGGRSLSVVWQTVLTTMRTNPHQETATLQRAFFCVSPDNTLRRLCISVVEHPLFEYSILMVILLNCVTLAMYTPYRDVQADQTNYYIEVIDDVFLGIFLGECILKIVAYGLVAHPGAYLRSTWNVLDFTVVVMGVVSTALSEIMGDIFDLTAIRIVRVLRPLRLISKVSSLQLVLNSLVRAMVPILHICFFVLFIIVIYAITGLQLFSGKLHRTCIDNTTGEMMNSPHPCAFDGESGFDCQQISNGSVCRDSIWEGPNHGITNFDNFGYAMLTVFQCITMDGWSYMLYYIQDAGCRNWAWIYFISLTVLGAMFVINLILGVLSGEFSKERERIRTQHRYKMLRTRKRIEGEMEGYLAWISRGHVADDHLTHWNMEIEEGYSHIPIDDWRMCLKVHCDFRLNLKPACKKMVQSQIFYWLIILLVLLNTMLLATEHHRQPVWLEVFQFRANLFFTAFFFLETLLKIYGLGSERYFKSIFNRIDLVVVIGSVAEVVLTYFNVIGSIGLSVLRFFRVLRVFKLTPYWRSLCRLTASLISSIASVASLLFLLCLFIIIFALLGMQIFGGRFHFDDTGENPRTNFDSFWQSLLTVFQILTGEDWSAVMYFGIRAYGGASSFGMFASLYFIILFICGNYILLNIFLAIAIDRLSGVDEKEAKEECVGETRETPTVEADCNNNVGVEGESSICKDPQECRANPYENRGHQSELPPLGKSFFIFSETNNFRVFCYRLCNYKYVQASILFCIVLSSVVLAVEDPLRNDTLRNTICEYSDMIFTAVFALELLIKLIAYGFILHKGAFCRSAFNLLDLMVVFVSVLNHCFQSVDISFVKSMRLLRVLRPLRAINRSEGLKQVIQCLVGAVKTIGNIALVTCLLIFVFAVIGVQLFKGKFFFCTDSTKMTEEECIGNSTLYINYVNTSIFIPGGWLNYQYNFDNIASSMLTLFIVSTFEEWPEVLYTSIDSYADNHGPVYNYRPLVALFYISFLVVISFFLFNIIVGFVIITYQTEGENRYITCELDKNQRECILFALEAKPTQKYVPRKGLSYIMWLVVSSSTFEYTILFAVLLNSVTLAMQFHNATEYYKQMLDILNIVFSMIFVIEGGVKLIAFDVKYYFYDIWNVFDGVVLLGSVVDILNPEKRMPVNFLRLFRVLRLLKLVSRSERIQTLIWTFLISFKALPYIAVVVGMLIFIYGVVGMQMFGTIALDEDTEINRNNNFQSFPQAALLLFRVATGEGWQDIMEDCSSGAVCDSLSEANGDNCGSNFTYIYFPSFYIFSSYLIINLLVAVIIDNFDYLTRDWSILSLHHLDQFIRKWAEYDPRGSGRISHMNLVYLLRDIPPPLGFGRLCPYRLSCRRLVAMNMPLNNDGTVSFNATLFALVRTSLRIKVGRDVKRANSELRDVINQIWTDRDLKVLDQVLPPQDPYEMTVGKFYATALIQDYFLRYRRRKKKKLEDLYQALYRANFRFGYDMGLELKQVQENKQSLCKYRTKVFRSTYELKPMVEIYSSQFFDRRQMKYLTINLGYPKAEVFIYNTQRYDRATVSISDSTGRTDEDSLAPFTISVTIENLPKADTRDIVIDMQ